MSASPSVPSSALAAGFDPIAPLRFLVEQVLAGAHALVSAAGLDAAGGAGWLLAVAALVVVVRAALIPLVVRQFRTQRAMRALAPELQRLRQRYRGRTDVAARQALAQETTAAYRQAGVHPLAPVLPALVQLPVLLALVQALEAAARGGAGPLATFAHAALLGVPLSAGVLAGGAAALLGVGVLVLTAAAQVLTTRIGLRAAPTGPDGTPAAQRVLLLALPLVSVGLCVAFPLGVTAYWLCSAVWTLGQQAVLTRLMA